MLTCGVDLEVDEASSERGGKVNTTTLVGIQAPSLLAPFPLRIVCMASSFSDNAATPSPVLTSLQRAVSCSLCGFLIVSPQEAERLFANLQQHGIHSSADARWLGEMRARQYHLIFNLWCFLR